MAPPINGKTQTGTAPASTEWRQPDLRGEWSAELGVTRVPVQAGDCIVFSEKVTVRAAISDATAKATVGV
jgi:hypothetical protein